MKIELLTRAGQEGLRRWAFEYFGDGNNLDNLVTEEWAWILFLLKNTEDKPEYFPHGKWATLQHIAATLSEDAKG